jgi:hypothetical protein
MEAAERTKSLRHRFAQLHMYIEQYTIATSNTRHDIEILSHNSRGRCISFSALCGNGNIREGMAVCR